MSGRLKVKICGLADALNACDVIALGPDFAGFVFASSSSRCVRGRLDFSLLKTTDQTIRTGVFVDEGLESLLSEAEASGLGAVQLHGAESPGFCESIRDRKPGIMLIKAFGIDESFDFKVTEHYSGACDCFLFDTASTMKGGSGRRFNWELLDKYGGKTPFFIAGGLGPACVREVRALGAKLPLLEGVDAGSLLEISSGIKNISLVRTFIEEIRR